MDSKIKVFKRVIEIIKEEDPSECHFICAIILCLHDVPVGETSKSLKYFESQKPTANLHSEFFNHELFIDNLAWWEWTEVDQRVKFLEMLIRKLSKDSLQKTK